MVIATYIPGLKPGRVIRVTFSPGHPGLTRFIKYPDLTRIDCTIDCSVLGPG